MTDGALAKNPEFSILIVDDEPSNIDILRGILSPHYQIKVASSGKIALKVVEQFVPDLILLDIMMPELDGLDVCKKLKSDPRIAKVPVIFVTALGQGEDEERGFSFGAVDYITKPVSPAIVLARVKTHISLAHQMRTTEQMVKIRTRELQDSQQSAIIMLASAGHYNDTDTGHHIWRMAAYCRCLALAAGWSLEDAGLLAQAAPMHDTGKIGIPDSILKAPRKLTDDEMTVMRTHALIGAEILSRSDTPLFRLASEIAHGHHEKWDGSGYPNGLKGQDIPQSARIVAIADVFDALTMRRPYKRAWEDEDAFAYVQQAAGSHFDPTLVAQFLSIRDKIVETKAYWNALESRNEQPKLEDLLL